MTAGKGSDLAQDPTYDTVEGTRSGVVDTLHAVIDPVLTDLGLACFDLDFAGGALRVTVERANGEPADLELITDATMMISRELDHADPISGRYTLEVTSPGLERPLRTAAHFQRAVGSVVNVTTKPEVEGERRVQGTLLSADDLAICVQAEEEPRRLRYDEIEKARTVFEWAAAPKPGGPRSRANTSASSAPPRRKAAP